MGVGDLLWRLDEALLPPIGRALVWLTQGAIRRRVVFTAGVVGMTSLLAASVWAARLPPSPANDVTVVRVGLAEGQPVSSYEADSGRELGGLDAERESYYALVSLRGYVAPDRLTSLLRGISVHRAYARAVLEGAQTDVVEITLRRLPHDLRTGMREVAATRDRQAQAYRRDAEKLNGSSEMEREQRESYRAMAAVSAAEAAAYRSMCSCLYAAVVRGTRAELRRLAEQDVVRTVDPAPEVTDLARAVFTPPLPEYPDNSWPVPSRTPTGPSSGSPTDDPSGSPSGSTSPPWPSSSASASGSPSPSAAGDGT